MSVLVGGWSRPVLSLKKEDLGTWTHSSWLCLHCRVARDPAIEVSNLEMVGSWVRIFCSSPSSCCTHCNSFCDAEGKTDTSSGSTTGKQFNLICPTEDKSHNLEDCTLDPASTTVITSKLNDVLHGWIIIYMPWLVCRAQRPPGDSSAHCCCWHMVPWQQMHSSTVQQLGN